MSIPCALLCRNYQQGGRQPAFRTFCHWGSSARTYAPSSALQHPMLGARAALLGRRSRSGRRCCVLKSSWAYTGAGTFRQRTQNTLSSTAVGVCRPHTP